MNSKNLRAVPLHRFHRRSTALRRPRPIGVRSTRRPERPAPPHRTTAHPTPTARKAPPPARRHRPTLREQRNLLLIRRQFDAHAPLELLPSENTDLVSPAVGKSRNPDLTYLPSEVLETTDNQVPAEAVAVAVELVSPSNPENDWVGRSATTPRWASRSIC
ncbi:hypothetical protein ACIF6L_05320 [Kitasatospora sp. NPDC086009]|uniref:hypothetical protein n=1 Tax=unclassified Kitasatospora TaxID=2633591 RepID=UPI0037C7CC91